MKISRPYKTLVEVHKLYLKFIMKKIIFCLATRPQIIKETNENINTSNIKFHLKTS